MRKKDSLDPGDLTEKEIRDLARIDRLIDADSLYDKRHRSFFDDIDMSALANGGLLPILSINKSDDKPSTNKIRIFLEKNRGK